MHSGDYFNVRNISGICGINEKEKAANIKTIGYKGIGFKTVFLNNHYVYIKTGDYSFRFDKKASKIKRLEAPWPILPVWTPEDEVAPEIASIFNAANKKYRVKIATRNVNIPGIQNFRDLGGYPSYSTKKQVRWGMIYRSAEIDSLECYSRRELRNLGIKTLIDLRASSETGRQSPLQKEFNVVHIPLATGDMENILKGIREEKIKSDTVYRMVEQMNRDLIDKYTTEYRQIFDILLDKNSYPVVIHCSSGKGRTGIVSALVLAALGINEDIIMEDYRLSNDYFNIPSASKDAYQLPARSQEAITTLFSAREDFLNAAKEEAERRYGDIDSYLQKGIGLNKDEIKRLRSILLSD